MEDLASVVQPSVLGAIAIRGLGITTDGINL